MPEDCLFYHEISSSNGWNCGKVVGKYGPQPPIDGEIMKEYGCDS
jgi:hypothetical protein